MILDMCAAISNATFRAFTVIDGQQRLTTIIIQRDF